MSITQRVEIEANVMWRTFKSPTSSRHIAICDVLNLCLEGEDEVELRSLIPEAMQLLMMDLLADDEIDEYLRERGWRAENLPQSANGDIEFHVPFELIAEDKRLDPTRRVS